MREYSDLFFFAFCFLLLRRFGVGVSLVVSGREAGAVLFTQAAKFVVFVEGGGNRP